MSYSGLNWNLDQCIGLDILIEEIILLPKGSQRLGCLPKTPCRVGKAGRQQFNVIREKQYRCSLFVIQEVQVVWESSFTEYIKITQLLCF